LINKLDKINERIEKKKLDNQNENIMRFECISLKREECSINVTRKERIQEHIREEKMINIHQKMKKIDELKAQKQIISNKKRMMQDEIKMKKEKILEKFDKLLQKRKIR